MNQGLQRVFYFILSPVILVADAWWGWDIAQGAEQVSNSRRASRQFTADLVNGLTDSIGAVPAGIVIFLVCAALATFLFYRALGMNKAK